MPLRQWNPSIIVPPPKSMTRVGFEPTPSYDDQEAWGSWVIKVDLNLTPWTNSAILPRDIIRPFNMLNWFLDCVNYRWTVILAHLKPFL